MIIMNDFYKYTGLTLIIICCMCAISASADDSQPHSVPLSPTLNYVDYYEGNAQSVDGPTLMKMYDPETELFYTIAVDRSTSTSVAISAIPINDLDISNERIEELKTKYNMYNYDIVFKNN